MMEHRKAKETTKKEEIKRQRNEKDRKRRKAYNMGRKNKENKIDCRKKVKEVKVVCK